MSLIIYLALELKIFCQKKEKKYMHELFEKQDPQHFQLDEVFDDYADNDGLEDIIRNKGMQNLNIDGQFYQYEVL